MKNCMRKLGPVFNTNRMVRDYTEKLYLPAATRGAALGSENLKRAVELAHAKDRLRHKWPGVRIVGVHTSGNGHFKVGQSIDRKSTRLNSSHANISYAVFCLKKKNKRTTWTRLISKADTTESQSLR